MPIFKSQVGKIFFTQTTGGENIISLKIFFVYKTKEHNFHYFSNIPFFSILKNKIKNLYFCGIKELNNPDPLHTEPKAHVEEKETLEDEQRESKLPKDIAEDNLILNQPRS